MSARKKWPVRVPLRASGIRAQEARSARKTWWAAEWCRSLEALRIGARLGRGRSYAENGQVLELAIDGPHAEAVVLGSRETPYRCTLDFRAADAAQARALAKKLMSNPMTVARLLVDELPAEVESIFAAAGLPLFPRGGWIQGPGGRKIHDIDTHCSCPDYANPCKHTAAALWLIGEEAARRPLSLLALRGVDLRAFFRETSARGRGARKSAPIPAALPPVPPTAAFASSPAALLKRLGPIPMWRGEERCMDALGRVYERAKPAAEAAARGESVDLRLESEKTLVKGAGLTLRNRPSVF